MRELAIGRLLGAALIALLSLPGMALAQSAISGRVTDHTGGFLTGVTVEAASHVLME